MWQIDGTLRLVSGKYPDFYYAFPVFRGGDLLVPDFTGPIPRLLAQPVSGGPDRLLGYMPNAETASFVKTGMAFNPKNGDILYTANVSYDTNIDLLTLTKH
jgi:hypothetical protein